MAENAVFIGGRNKQHDYCVICEGKGPVTIYECPSCKRINDLHKPKGKVSTATVPTNTLE